MRTGKERKVAGLAMMLCLGLANLGSAQEKPVAAKAEPLPPLPPTQGPDFTISPSPFAPAAGAPPVDLPSAPSGDLEGGPGGFFLGAEYLLMKPRRDALDFAIRAPNSQGYPNGTIEFLDWDLRSGARAEVGYRLPGATCWEATTAFTYLNSGASQVVTAPPGGTVFATLTHPGGIEQVATAVGTSHLIYKVLDADLGRRFEAGDDLGFRLFAGGRAAWINQDLDAFYNGGDANMAHVSSPINFQGGGIRVGGEGNYRMPWGLRLFARASGALLVGDFHTNLVETNNNGATVNTAVSRDFAKVVPVAELGLGVAWQYRNFQVSVAYEFANWFNLVDSPDFVDDLHQGKMSRRAGDLSLEGLALQVGLSY